MEDIYHYVPIAAKLGRTPKACSADLKFAIEQSTQGTFSSIPADWAGGWMFGYNGVSFDLDACNGLMGATNTAEELMDVTEAVVQYLRGNLGGTVTAANLPSHRLTVKRLPSINPPGYNFRMIQPIKGASTATCPAL